MSVDVATRAGWTAPGAKQGAERTYASVKTALARSHRLSAYSYEVFLQGSYANATNLRGDSDVDIVAMLKSTYISDLSRLTYEEKALYERNRSPGTFDVSQFRTDVEAALRNYYGFERVKGKDKCIRVERQGDFLDADVVPSYQRRMYTSYSAYNVGYIEGIEIRPRSGGAIINYPKEHIKNGQTKNGRCHDRYKQTVRQVKRLANHAAGVGKFEKGTVPGYVLECMVYNVPCSLFEFDDSKRLVAVMLNLHLQSPQEYAAGMKSCDEIHRLFVDDPGKHNQYRPKG